jgi:hypothetical protein
LIDEVTRKNEKAQAEEQLATVQEANAKEKNEAAEKSKSIAEAALSEALPAIHAAAVAVNVLKKDSYLG